MKTTVDHDFELEHRLWELAPDLHGRFTDTVFALQYKLSEYKRFFPEFTDHTNLHSLSVIHFCNLLIGSRLGLLNADEIYILLTACYFHDTGMGITEKDYGEFSRNLPLDGFFESHPGSDVADVIREFHHELSGMFIRKYAALFEIPSEEHLQAIVQVARGHRRTDLLDEKEYPLAFALPGGGTACLPYLAALIRLADEIDVSAERNPATLYDIRRLKGLRDIIENRKVQAVHSMDVTEDAFVLHADCSDPEIREQLYLMAGKMQITLDECRRAVNGRTPFAITQERVEILEIRDGET